MIYLDYSQSNYQPKSQTYITNQKLMFSYRKKFVCSIELTNWQIPLIWICQLLCKCSFKTIEVWPSPFDSHISIYIFFKSLCWQKGVPCLKNFRVMQTYIIYLLTGLSNIAKLYKTLIFKTQGGKYWHR